MTIAKLQGWPAGEGERVGDNVLLVVETTPPSQKEPKKYYLLLTTSVPFYSSQTSH